ncbi:MAG: tRNA (adenosine(37)-N6)-threonylcarbamoyltransferase complex ATPase subunit type 1 TsaE [Verrucomicrobiota bacterium]|nr:tRNA (adenosine(37)-N6)-threonylcarbamoyltransferase complex ATPase subunit type 1 TsaE [Verrucomicrobiota bacterium]
MGRERVEKLLVSHEETLIFGAEIASRLKPNSILALHGDLGAGKTTFVQGLLRGLHIDDIAQSPTFTYLQMYPGVYHFDLYRLKEERDFVALGFEEFFEAGGIAAIEWPERIPSILPHHTYHIYFSHTPEGGRYVQALL